jgi:hypothetical protein
MLNTSYALRSTVWVVEDVIPFSRDALAGDGFAGFLRIATLRKIGLSAIPDEPGCYVVLRESNDPPCFLNASPTGRFKGRDPTIPVDELRTPWIDRCHAIYIGQSGSLQSAGRLGSISGLAGPSALGEVERSGSLPTQRTSRSHGDHATTVTPRKTMNLLFSPSSSRSTAGNPLRIVEADRAQSPTNAALVPGPGGRFGLCS